MAKLGVKSIKGSTSPQIGQNVFYEVQDFYPGTPIADHNKVKWNLYAIENGKLRLLDGGPTKTGRKVSYNFPSKWYGKSLMIEAYMHAAEKKAPPGLIVKPVQGPKKVTALDIKDGNGNTFSKKPKYGEHITIIVTTENMVGDEIDVAVWERDTFSDSGHDAKANTLLWSKKFKVANKNGIVRERILLDTGMMAKANKTFDGFEHEYYLVVKSGNKVTHSKQTAIISNSEVVLSPQQKSTPSKPATAPAQKEEEGIFTTITKPIIVTAKVGWDMIMDALNKPVTVNSADTKGCEGKFCIKKGDPKSELIREINIRLSGFGGNVPTDEFTDRTEKMIKQFQRDYMKVPETGKVCGNVLKAIDEFQNKYNFDFNSIKCKCGTCTGFGDNSHKGEYLGAKVEAYHRYEYPGLHRSLLWALKAVIFYLEKDGRFTLNKINSGYRCRFHPEYLKKPTTNHMGKAMDLHFNDKDGRTREIKDMETIRLDIFNKYLGAKWDWKNDKDIFFLESTRVGATTWVHYDVREFNPQNYLQDKFFVKTLPEMNGQNIILLAKDLGHQNTCSCLVAAPPREAAAPVNCTTCTALDAPRKKFYEEFGTAAIKMVEGKGKSNKFKGLYMVAQRRQENSFNLHVPNNNPMNIKGSGDLGSAELSTHEYINGEKVYMNDGFANFSTVEKGFEGYLALLDRNFNTAYNSILDDSKSIDDFLSGMQDHGRLGAYATDPNYKTAIKNIFNGVVRDYKKWLNCKLNCQSYASSKASIEADIKLLDELK